MISEMKKSLKAILYERVTSPLSGILIIAWLLFNWKACLVLILGTDTIYQRISFIEKHYVSFYDNLYYPVCYALAFILIYPWVALGPFYIWQRSNYLKNKIKFKFELQTPLTLEQSIELRKEMRQKEIEFTEMLTSKNAKQIELETEIQHLQQRLNESEDKYANLVKESSANSELAIIPTEPNTFNHNADEQKWVTEYKEVYQWDNKFKQGLEDVLDAIANGVTVNTDSRKYCLAQGLVKIDTNGQLALTSKGEFLSRFTNSGWRNTI